MQIRRPESTARESPSEKRLHAASVVAKQEKEGDESKIGKKKASGKSKKLANKKKNKKKKKKKQEQETRMEEAEARGKSKKQTD